jgi:hypothetical protein
MSHPAARSILGAGRRRLGEEGRHVAAKAHDPVVAVIPIPGTSVRLRPFLAGAVLWRAIV